MAYVVPGSSKQCTHTHTHLELLLLCLQPNHNLLVGCLGLSQLCLLGRNNLGHLQGTYAQHARQSTEQRGRCAPACAWPCMTKQIAYVSKHRATTVHAVHWRLECDRLSSRPKPA